jgi:hypothetical protein
MLRRGELSVGILQVDGGDAINFYIKRTVPSGYEDETARWRVDSKIPGIHLTPDGICDPYRRAYAYNRPLLGTMPDFVSWVICVDWLPIM